MKTLLYAILVTAILIVAACERHTTVNPAEGAVIRRAELGYDNIKDVVEDSAGYIWFGTPGGVYQYNGTCWYQHRSTSDSTSLCNDAVLKMYCSRQGRLFVLTEFGVSVYNGDGSFRTIFNEGTYPYASDITETPDGRIFLSISDGGTNIYEYDTESGRCTKRIPGFMPVADSLGNVWVWRQGAAYCYSSTEFSIAGCVTMQGQPDAAAMLPDGNIFYHTQSETIIIDPATRQRLNSPTIDRVAQTLAGMQVKKVTPYGKSAVMIYAADNQMFLWDVATGDIIGRDNPQFPFHNSLNNISKVLLDSHGNIWVASERTGYDVVYHHRSPFRSHSALADFFSNRDITNIAAGRAGELFVIEAHHLLWHVGADGIPVQASLSHIIPGEEIDQCYVDSKGDLWLVTNHGIAQCSVSGSGRLNLLRRIPMHTYTVGEDSGGNIWFEHDQDLYRLKRAASVPEKILNDIGLVNTIRRLDSDRIIVSTYAGCVYVVDVRSGDARQIEIPRSRSTGVVCMDLIVAGDGTAWGVSYGQGLMHIYPDSGKVLFHYDPNVCGQMCSLTVDRSGNLWIGTLRGLVRFDPRTGRFIAYDRDDGIVSDTYSPKSAVALADGKLIFGATRGLTVFRPGDVKPDRRGRIRMEYVSANQQLLPSGSGNPVAMEGDSIVGVTLPHDNSGVYFYYSTLDYGHLNRYKTEFLLDGLDRQWHSLENEDYAYYSHIPPGSYNMQVRAVNEAGDVIDAKTVPVEVTPPLWANKWLIFGLYPLCALLIAWGAWRIVRHIRRNKAQIRSITLQREQEKHANEMNMKYFTNISHEFRTPLTMIYGAVKMLDVRATDISGKSALFNVIRLNTDRMLKLINQLLDFSKMENGMLRLKVAEYDVVALTNDCIERFAMGFRQKGIKFTRTIGAPVIRIMVDDDKFDKILTNLVSNAIKYTPEGGAVCISVGITDRKNVVAAFPECADADAERWLQVSVADTGTGIPADKQQSVFDRFYQIENPKMQGGWGTGIGLCYTRALVEMHHGYIKCTSNDPCGSVFTFVIPVMDTNETTVHPDEAIVTEFLPSAGQSLDNDTQLAENTEAAKSAPTILVVDDDTQVLHFMQLLLRDRYNVVCRTNPNTTIGEIRDIRPDLIISDILMHGISGYEFCHKVKTDPMLCHLPVILLTAQSSPQHQLQGISAGADAYVVKPFDPQYLETLIQTTLSNREKIRRVLSSATTLNIEEQPVMQSYDGKFMEQLYAWMDSHLSDAELDLGPLLDALAISRSKFFYKVKELTGLAPNAFFRTYKLNRAAKMIREDREKLTYIAELTGFCSLSHFSASFKKQFGCTPSQYKDSSEDIYPDIKEKWKPT